MADTFTNDLRLRLQESGANSGTWGELLNGTITNIASALGQGSEAIPNASTHTITLADGTADEARSLYLKCTGGGQACTVTLGPNTISKVWIIDNETSFTLTFSQGSGANVAIAAGAVKVIATDGAGSGAAVVDTLDGLEGSMSTLAVSGALTANGGAVFNEASADVDFRVESDGNANMLFVNGGTNGVGIGTSTPNTSYALDVSGAIPAVMTSTSTATTAMYGGLGVKRETNTNGNGTGIGFILEDAGDAETEYAYIGGIIESNTAGSEDGGMILSTTLNNVRTQRMRIASSGKVGIGESSPAATLHLDSTGVTAIAFDSDAGTQQYEMGTGYAGVGSANNFYLYNNTANSAPLIVDASSNVGIGTTVINSTLSVGSTDGGATITSGGTNTHLQLKAMGSAGVIIFGAGGVSNGTAGTERMRIDASGNLLIGKTSAGTAQGFEAQQDGEVYSSIVNGLNTYHVFANSAYRFYVAPNGGIYNYSSNNVNLSDEREKKNIEALESQWDSLKQWSLKKFHYNADADSDTKKLGVIAQEVEAHNPEVVSEFNVNENTIRMAVKEQQMMWMAIKALQEAQERIETLETKVKTLEA